MYPKDFLLLHKGRDLFRIDEDRKFMLQKNWKRPVTDSSFFLNEKLEWMEKNNLDHAIVLNLSQLYGNGLRVEEMKKVLRWQNDFNGQVQADHPDKFSCGFVIHAGFVRSALWEIERCVKDLNLRVLCLPTHYMDSIGTWRTIFDPETEPIFELANEHKLAVEIHPYDGEKFIKLENVAWRFHLVWMLAQCADAYHFYTLQGYHEKFPDMRVCFAHGGQLAQINLGRRIQGFDGRPDLFEGKTHPRRAVGHPNIFFDTLVHDTYSLELMVKRLKGTDQIILGLDDPYPLGEMESEPQSSYPGKLLDLALEEGIINQQQHEEIWKENVLRWLGVNQCPKLKERLKHLTTEKVDS
ncbi:MAG: amidohydrolase family protein [Bacteroidota bacterium]